MSEWAIAVRRALPMLLWAGLVAFGLLVLAWSRPQPSSGPVAQRDLPVNTLLFKHDLVPDQFAYQYVIAPEGIRPNSVVSPRSVGPLPVMPAALSPGVYFSLPVTAAEIVDGVNAQATAQLCASNKQAIVGVQVQVVRCDPSPPGVRCFALVRLQDADKSKAEAVTKDLNSLTLSRTCKP